MAKRQRTSSKEIDADVSTSTRTIKGKARTPDAPPLSAEVAAPPEPLRPKKRGGTRAGATAVESAAVADFQLLSQPESELRDIGELTFGRRVVTPPAQPGAEATSAANSAQRNPVPNVAQPPFRGICDLLITARDGTRHSGTGWFISRRTLVTAGHCVFVFAPGQPVHGFVRSIQVMPARHGETGPAQSLFGWALAPEGSFKAPQEWRINRDLGFDYGVIVLPENAPLAPNIGFFNFDHFPALDETAPVLSGYPDDVPEGTQWFERNLIKEVTPTRVFYDIFTSTGSSGSPLFFNLPQGIVACAIHSFGDAPFNSGVRINPNVAAQLNAWKV